MDLALRLSQLSRRFRRPIIRALDRRPFPQILWHYCSVDSFNSILSSKTIWATDITKSNDPNELQTAIPEIDRGLAEYPQLDNLVGGEGWLGVIAGSRKYFATCFSSQGDSLSQWRTYGDAGKGFAIGFDRRVFRRMALTNTLAASIDLYEVLYDREQFGVTLRNYIDDYLKAYKQAGRPIDELDLYCDLRFRGMCLKSSFFEPEAEWRLGLHLGMNEDRHLDEHTYKRDGVLQHYRPIMICEEDEHCVTHVVQGPNNSADNNVVQDYLSASGFTGVSVDQSKGAFLW